MRRSSNNILNQHTQPRFSGDTLFDKIAQAVCSAECLPRKELYESWETAKRVRRVFRGQPILELAAGHGLLSAILLILDNTSPTATCIDVSPPQNRQRLIQALEKKWPRIKNRIHYKQCKIEQTSVGPNTLLASVHACGVLTDQVLDLAIATRNPVAVLPCCHDLKTCDLGGLSGWMDGPLAIDATRAARLKKAGFNIKTLKIPSDITPKNRLLLAGPN